MRAAWNKNETKNYKKRQIHLKHFKYPLYTFALRSGSGSASYWLFNSHKSVGLRAPEKCS